MLSGLLPQQRGTSAISLQGFQHDRLLQQQRPVLGPWTHGPASVRLAAGGSDRFVSSSPSSLLPWSQWLQCRYIRCSTE